MTGHERPTPWELIFAAPGFAQERFAAVRREEEEAGRARTPAELSMLPAAGELLRELVPREASGGHGEVVAEVSALVFAAYRFWLHGRQVWRFDEAATRRALTRRMAEQTPVRAPAPAGYVQLARNIVWARVSATAAAEPVDGFFWSAPALEQEPGPARLDVLYALGVRRGRPGLSLVDVALDLSDDLGSWARTTARADGADFANVLPGGELQRYHAIITRAEAIKLAALCFGAIAEASTERAADEEGGQRLTLVHG